jgi:hypothetical protein
LDSYQIFCPGHWRLIPGVTSSSLLRSLYPTGHQPRRGGELSRGVSTAGGRCLAAVFGSIELVWHRLNRMHELPGSCPMPIDDLASWLLVTRPGAARLGRGAMLGVDRS